MHLDDAALAGAAADLCASPAWYPLKAAGDQLSLVHLNEADYAAASFLDERLLGHGAPMRALPCAAAAAAAARLSARAHYLFHIGHVGSTLISRLVGARPHFFALREPALLRALSRAPSSGAPLSLRAHLALFARTWRAEQRSVIKLTSLVSEIGPQILAASEGAPRALLVYATPLAYLRGIFGGPNSRRESQALAPERLRRLTSRHPALKPLATRSEGEWIAMSWLCEMSALAAIAQGFAAQVHWVDFDAFLASPALGLAAILSALGSPTSAPMVEELAAGPIMQRYSKAPEHAYDAELRREVLAGADQDFRAEIHAGLRWLAAAGRADSALAAILAERG